jgi:WD repeat-containing protein 48
MVFHSREQNWVASGSFDRTIKLWDLSRSEQQDALVTLNPADATAPKSSVYALAADPFGHTIVSGSPERVVRLWDPRTGKRIGMLFFILSALVANLLAGKLVGHTDNIRAILISDDSKYVCILGVFTLPHGLTCFHSSLLGLLTVCAIQLCHCLTK